MSATPLLIKSIFPTIQGEGPFAGRSAIFVRLGSCNLACPKCDTDFASNTVELSTFAVFGKVAELAAAKTPLLVGLGKEAIGFLRREACSLVVITGGEPFAHPIEDLVRLLLQQGFQVQIETNGSLFRLLPFYDPNLHIVCSPKLPKIHPKLEPLIRSFKYLIRAGEVDTDGLPLHSFGGVDARPARPPLEYTGKVYLQPVDEGTPDANKENLHAAIASCLQYNHTLCVQIHKIIRME